MTKRHLPTLYSEAGTTLELYNFGGYDPHPDGAPGRFVQMQNLTSASYPLMRAGCSWRHGLPVGDTPLAPRNYYKICAFHDKLITLEYLPSGDTKVRYDGDEVGYIFGEQVNTIIARGDMAYFFPAGYLFDRTDLTFKSLTSYWDNDIGGSAATEVTYSLCDSEGVDYEYFAADVFDFLPDYKYWLETGKTPYVLQEYNYKLGVYVPVKETYIKITKDKNKNPADFADMFDPGDTVEITDCDNPALNKRSNVIKAVGRDYIVVPGMTNNKATQHTQLSIKTHIPRMKYVLLHKNRFWGVCAEGREIMASSLGNPRSWYDYSNTAYGSYAASVGDGGEFIGGVSYNGNIWFFKPDKVYRVLESNYPAVAIYEMPLPGAYQDSMTVIDNVLYYKSPRGIYAFDGYKATPIQSNLPKEYLQDPDPQGGGCGGKYYLSLRQAREQGSSCALFVYDISRQVWHKESLGLDGEGNGYFPLSFTGIQDKLYFVRYPGALRPIEYIDPFATSITDDHRLQLSPVWQSITGDFLSKSATPIYIREISVVYQGTLQADIKYDSDGEFVPLGEAPYSSVKTCRRFLPLPRRCRHFALRFFGNRDCTLYSVTVKAAKGGDRT